MDGQPLRSHTPAPTEYLDTTLAGQFRLTAVAGRGMGGVVYRAWQDGMERDVAVKILHRQLLDDPNMVRRFHREAQAVARLSHPNIVNVFTTGTTDYGAPYLVMEYIEGERLDHALTEPLPVDRAVAIARQLVSALADTHAEGIIHRDLKPANVFLVQHRRTSDFVKILDFGIAKLHTADGDACRLTRDGAVCGTPHYIAPEQASGHAVDHRADLYSVGVILYQMVTGRVPFEGTGMAVLLAHVNKAVVPPRELGDVPVALERIILRCLAKDRAQRYQSADELADALDQFANGGHVLASAPTVKASPAAKSDDSSATPLAFAADSLVDLPAPRRRWKAALAYVAVLGLLVLAGARFAPRYAPASYANHATPAVAVNASTATAESDRLFEQARRALVVSGGRYSLRVILPERVLAGMHHEIDVDLWDAAGKPLVTREVVVTLSRKWGGSVGVAAKPTHVRGRYRFHRMLDKVGDYTLSVFPPGADDAIQVFFEVLAPDADSDS